MASMTAHDIQTTIGGHIPDWLARHASMRPRHMAIQHADGTLDYATLYQQAVCGAGWLKAHGVEPGMRVALATRHGLTYARGLHAIMQCRAIVVPVNLRLTPTEIAWQLNNAGVALVWTDDANTGLLTDAVERSEHQVPVVDVQEASRVAEVFGAETSGVQGISGFEGTSGFEGASGLGEDASQRKPSDEAYGTWIDLHRVHAIVYTSGTTGYPKGVQITYGNHLWAAFGSALQLGLDVNERWLVPMPLFHVGGMGVLVRSVVYGTTAVLHDAFDPALVNRELTRGAITLVSVVPTMLQRMLRHPDWQPYASQLRCVLLGGSAAPRDLLEACQDRGIPVAQSYGMTETNAQVVTLRPEDGLRKIGSSGKPLLHVEVRIQAEDHLAEPGEVGEIQVHSPTVTAGYWQREDATRDAIVDGWLHTGDVGYLDEEGYLFVLDRQRDLIVSGGENIYPAEVERVLERHPAIREVGVVGATDSEWGQVPVAFVVLAEDAEVPLVLEGASVDVVLETWCRQSLASYKVPKRFITTSKLPRNASGKLLRRRLVEWLEES